MLVILDGWGISDQVEGNALKNAQLPCYTRLKSEYPYTTLEASGEYVGLPAGQMGNSEVGHLNMGAGRVVYQELTRINRAIKQGDFMENKALVQGIQSAKEKGQAVHFMGLLSDGGVHSHIEHLFALLDMAKKADVKKVYVHAFLDGRDVSPTNAKEYIVQLEQKMKELGVGTIATVMGRFYAMDRDRRWDRTAQAYGAMVEGTGKKATMAVAAVEQSYDFKITDEFVEPTVIVDEKGKPKGLVSPGDTLIFFNFRADRARQITRSFIEPDFTAFVRPKGFLPLHYVCFTQYDCTFKAPVAFPPQNLRNTLGEVLSSKGLKQARIAETEKYAHVTFFFNGGVEEPYPGEERFLIPSPKVATYNLKPEMSALEVTDKVVELLKSQEYQFIVLNYANPDMVGHTGFLDAAVQACEIVDKCLERIVAVAQSVGGTIVVTADHGNAEKMIDPETQEPHTAHTQDQVPFVLVGEKFKDQNISLRKKGSLQDIAPTILEVLAVEKPKEMTGESLIIRRFF
ncbi:2,3-bisphosphoglycerate-independent phosphoglycerate mutase [Bacillota bacterium LX-D]|nr:2,3-bisphosphoglycerate-independent phosphoglycerate mutase [Bacillota bacterium LX-D]